MLGRGSKGEGQFLKAGEIAVDGFADDCGVEPEASWHDNTLLVTFGREPRGLAASIAYCGWHVFVGYMRVPPAPERQWQAERKRILRALTPERAVAASAFLAHGLNRLLDLQRPDASPPVRLTDKQLEVDGLSKLLLADHYPQPEAELAALSDATAAYGRARTFFLSMSEAAKEFGPDAGEPMDASGRAFETVCGAHALHLVLGEGVEDSPMRHFDPDNTRGEMRLAAFDHQQWWLVGLESRLLAAIHAHQTMLQP